MFTSTDGNGLVLAAYSAQTHNCWFVVDTPAVTGAVAPFGTPASPAQGLQAATANAVFLDTQVGPTYGEIKGNSVATATLQPACIASQPSVTNATNYGTSTTAFPAL